MAFFTQRNTVKFVVKSLPEPRYDIEPVFAAKPLPGAMRRQLAELLARAIADTVDNGMNLESDEELDPMWQVDWGQMLASGTELEYLSEIVDLVDREDLDKMLLTAFYAAARVILASNEEPIAEIMSDIVLSMMLGGTMEPVEDGSPENGDMAWDADEALGKGDEDGDR
jgi:hypothetical protein